MKRKLTYKLDLWHGSKLQACWLDHVRKTNNGNFDRFCESVGLNFIESGENEELEISTYYLFEVIDKRKFFLGNVFSTSFVSTMNHHCFTS